MSNKETNDVPVAKKYVSFSVTEDEWKELKAAAEKSKVALASIARRGTFKEAKELTNEAA